MSSSADTNVLKTAWRDMRGALFAVAIFSAAVNLLMLTGPLFMLQVYDRVLASRSVPTLVALFVLVAVLYGFLALFDFIRARILSRTAHKFDAELSPYAQKIWIHQGLTGLEALTKPDQDLGVVRQFIGSNALAVFFDLPWVPFYLFIIFMLHFWLGLLALSGAVIVVVLTAIGELATRGPLKKAAPFELSEALLGQQLHKNADAVVALGMTGYLSNLWTERRNNALGFSQSAGSKTELLGALTKGTRMLVQSAILGLGAWLAIEQQISAGTIVAASILAGRALAPVDQAVGNWRGFARARMAYGRLQQVMGHIGTASSPMTLPQPKGVLAVTGLVKLPPNQINKAATSQKPLLFNLQFSLEPGDGLGVIGPSASGKSTLAKLLVGLWMSDQGTVRLDGATYDLWDREILGRHLGYLPQDVGLLPGSIRQNIGRFNPDVRDEEILEAAKLAGVHELILRLPDGYDAQVGDGWLILSGGQAQRIALARAVFGKPCLVVLDEPNANLDAEGDLALTNCITKLREVGSTVVVMAHRPSAISAVNKILMLNNGKQMDFGDKDAIIRKASELQAVSKAS